VLNPILVHISTTIFIGEAVKNGIILMGHQPLKSDVSVATDLSANVQNASIKCQPWGEKTSANWIKLQIALCSSAYYWKRSEPSSRKYWVYSFVAEKWNGFTPP
jgi:hypothetical protein